MNDLEESRALLAATQALMRPLARLLVARGVPYANVEESLKAAMVDAAREAHSGGLAHRLVSRIATTTGINRREVTRLTRAGSAPAAAQRSAVADLFTRWRTAAPYCDAAGQPRTLPRQGGEPSFESLARGVTQDVHPRSLLDELLRLGMASHDLPGDTVTLTLGAFVPSADRSRMLEFLAHNVGDHLSAAVENVIGPAPRHLERAVFGDGLSPEAIAAAQAWVARTWSELLRALVPFLEELVAEDARNPERDRTHRLRTGLYVYTEREAAAEAGPPAPAPAPAKSSPRRASAAKRRSPRSS